MCYIYIYIRIYTCIYTYIRIYTPYIIEYDDKTTPKYIQEVGITFVLQVQYYIAELRNTRDIAQPRGFDDSTPDLTR